MPRIVKIKAVANTLPPGEFYVRHFNNEGELTAFDPANPNAFRDDFRFKLVELDGNRVQFNSVNFPDKFLRHKNFRVLLEAKTPGDGSFDADSTFISDQPNAGNFADGKISFGASNPEFPNHFIRHRDFHVFVNEVTDGDEQAKQDSTFVLEDSP
jgi:Alpha-L-arabinofuranosidase B (ABFB) domain